MDILGTYHAKWRWEKIEKKLEERYPKGINSLVIEVPANLEENREYANEDSLFILLANKYQNLGGRVIYGDIPYDFAFSKKLKRIEKENARGLKRFFQELGVTMEYLLTTDITGFREGVLKKRERDEHFAEVIKRENPQVVIVGGAHAKYLSKVFPEANYKFL